MKKKLTSLLLCILLAFGQVQAAAPEQAQQPTTQPTAAEQQMAEMEAELELAQLPLYDRYIVKLKPTNSLAAANTTLDAAVEAAIPAAKQAANMQVQEVLTEKQITEDTELFDLAETPAYTVEHQSPQLLTVSLTEKVDAAAFTAELGSNAQIEYIQPDYALELASDVVLDLDLSELTPAGTPVPAATETPEATGTPEIGVEITPEQTQRPETTQRPEAAVEPEETPDPGTTATPATTPTPAAAPVVAVIDAGIDVAHHGLTAQMLPGYDFVNNTELTYDYSRKSEYVHGTHVAGIIAQNAPEAQILPLKVFEHGRAYTSDIIRAVEYAQEHGASVVNMSFGGADDNRALREVMQASNMLFVCAAGNARTDVEEVPVYPACFDLENIISVASLNQDLGFSYYSNYGTESVDIAAVGRDVYSMWPEGEYGEMSGTSQAAAQVSAGAAEALARGDADAKAAVLERADRYAHLMNKVADGRSLNLFNVAAGAVSEGVQTVAYEDDFDVHGYEPTPEENWELFSSVPNVQVAAGYDFNLALKADGSVWAWGSNEFGQLGRNPSDVLVDTTPTRVIGLTNIIQIAAGSNHAVALKSDNTVWTWGENTDGQLGYLKGTNEYLPRQVEIGWSIYEIFAGESRTFGTGGGGVWYWGYNLYERGNTFYTGSYIPKFIEEETVSASGCSDSNYITKSDGSVWGWGWDRYGLFGAEYTQDEMYDVIKNERVSDVASIHSGYGFNIGRKTNGDAVIWGNTRSLTGNGYSPEPPVTLPTVLDIHNIRQISVNEYNILLLLEDGTVWRVGFNGSKFNGVTPEDATLTPVQILGLQNIKTISAGLCHGLAITEDGKIFGWGNNSVGKFVSGDTQNYAEPVAIGQDGDFGPSISPTEISAGNGHSLVIDESGGVLASGRGSHGQLGNGARIDSATPVQVKDAAGTGSFTGAKSVAAGFLYSLALKEDGTLWTWGNATGFMTDTGDNHSDIPVQVVDESGQPLTNIISISAKKEHWLALRGDGTVWAWGRGANGQLGNGETEDVFTHAVQVKNADGTPLTDVIAVSAGGYHSMAKKADGTIWAWGKNENGQLGNGAAADSSVPVQIMGLTGIEQIAAGEFHSMALRADGTIWTWGRNQYGQLGDNTRNSSAVPVQVTGENGFGYLTDVEEIAAGIGYSMALMSDGTLMAWGHNNSYQLGDGTQQSRNAPVEVKDAAGTGALTNVVEFSANNEISMAKTADGKVWIWGMNRYGEFGDGTSGRNSALPVEFGVEGEDPGTSLTLQGSYIVVSAEDMTDPDTRFKLTYDQTKLNLINIAAQKNLSVLTPGTYGRLAVESVADGEIVFGLNLTLENGEKWSGAITVFEAQALTEGETTVSLSVL